MGALLFECREGADALEGSDDGFTVLTNADGSVQLAIYWTGDDGVRRTFHLAEDAKPKVVLELARALNAAAECSRLGRTFEVMGTIRTVPRGASASSNPVTN